MKYPNIKEAKLSHAEIAKYFGFKSVKSFNTTSAHKRYMTGVENMLEYLKQSKEETFREQYENNTIQARSTLYPGKSIEQIREIVKGQFNSMK